MPKAIDFKTFVPSKEYELSIQFYIEMGWTLNWKVDGLAEMQIADHHFSLQNYYHRGWANNFMLYIDVENAALWHQHALSVLASGKYGKARTDPPKVEDHGIAC